MPPLRPHRPFLPLTLAMVGLALGAQGKVEVSVSHSTLAPGARSLLQAGCRQDPAARTFRSTLDAPEAGTFANLGEVEVYTAPTGLKEPTGFQIKVTQTGPSALGASGAIGTVPILVVPGAPANTLLHTGWLATLPAVAALCQTKPVAPPNLQGARCVCWVNDPALGDLDQHWLVGHRHGITAVAPDGRCREVVRTQDQVCAIALRSPGENAAEGPRVAFSTGVMVPRASSGTPGAGASVDLGQLFSLDAKGDVALLAGRLDPEAGFHDGPADQATFGVITGLALAADGTLYLADYGTQGVRTLTPGAGVHTLSGSVAGPGPDTVGHPPPVMLDGPQTKATFLGIRALDLDPVQNCLYVSDGSTIRRVSLAGSVTTVLGNPSFTLKGVQDGVPPPGMPAFKGVFGLQVVGGKLLIADTLGDAILRCNLADGHLVTLAAALTPPAIRSGPLGRPAEYTRPDSGGLQEPFALSMNPEGLCLVCLDGNGVVMLDLSLRFWDVPREKPSPEDPPKFNKWPSPGLPRPIPIRAGGQQPIRKEGHSHHRKSSRPPRSGRAQAAQMEQAP